MYEAHALQAHKWLKLQGVKTLSVRLSVHVDPRVQGLLYKSFICEPGIG